MAMSSENKCIIPGFGEVIETSRRHMDRKWNDRGANANDIEVTYTFDEYTHPLWVVDKVRLEIEKFVADFKKNNHNNISVDHTTLGNFRKNILEWHDRQSFTTEEFAQIMTTMSVDVKRSNIKHVSYSLAFFYDMSKTSPKATGDITYGVDTVK